MISECVCVFSWSRPVCPSNLPYVLHHWVHREGRELARHVGVACAWPAQINTYEHVHIYQPAKNAGLYLCMHIRAEYGNACILKTTKLNGITWKWYFHGQFCRSPTVTLLVPSVSKEEGWPQETLFLPFTTLASVISMPYKYLNLVCPPALVLWEHTPLVWWKSSKPCFNDCERNDVNWLPAVPAHSQKCKFSHL